MSLPKAFTTADVQMAAGQSEAMPADAAPGVPVTYPPTLQLPVLPETDNMLGTAAHVSSPAWQPVTLQLHTLPAPDLKPDQTPGEIGESPDVAPNPAPHPASLPTAVQLTTLTSGARLDAMPQPPALPSLSSGHFDTVHSIVSTGPNHGGQVSTMHRPAVTALKPDAQLLPEQHAVLTALEATSPASSTCSTSAEAPKPHAGALIIAGQKRIAEGLPSPHDMPNKQAKQTQHVKPALYSTAGPVPLPTVSMPQSAPMPTIEALPTSQGVNFSPAAAQLELPGCQDRVGPGATIDGHPGNQDVSVTEKETTGTIQLGLHPAQDMAGNQEVCNNHLANQDASAWDKQPSKAA